jgi:hypothetical protein
MLWLESPLRWIDSRSHEVSYEVEPGPDLHSNLVHKSLELPMHRLHPKPRNYKRRTHIIITTSELKLQQINRKFRCVRKKAHYIVSEMDVVTAGHLASKATFVWVEWVIGVSTMFWWMLLVLVNVGSAASHHPRRPPCFLFIALPLPANLSCCCELRSTPPIDATAAPH